MSNRKDAFKPKSTNPAQIFLEWKSDHKCFSYYDKEKKETIAMPLPFKFVALEEMHTIKGWNDSSESGIYANEVKFIGKTPVKVQSFKGGLIAEGIYKDIKLQVVASGGVYHKSIYGMLEDGTMVNLALKGSSVREWGEFTKKTKNRLPDEWITINEAKEEKKGTVTYSTPIFFFSSVLSKEESEMADVAFDVLEKYLKEYSKDKEEEKEEEKTLELETEQGEGEPLPF